MRVLKKSKSLPRPHGVSLENSEEAKISFVEGFLLILLAASADVAELVGSLLNIVPVIGQLAWFTSYIYGLFVSWIIIMWAALRGMGGVFFKRRLAILGGGTVIDALFGGFLPARTFFLILAIWLNNRMEQENVRLVTGFPKRKSLLKRLF